MFPEGERLPWDAKGDYTRNSLSIFVIMNQVEPFNATRPSSRERKVKVNSTSLLSAVLGHKDYVVPGTPVFFIVSNRYLDTFLKKPIHLLGHH